MDLLRPSSHRHVDSGSHNNSKMLDNSLQNNTHTKNFINATHSSSVGISSYEKYKDVGEAARGKMTSGGMHNYKNSNEIDNMYLEQIESTTKSRGGGTGSIGGQPAGHEKTQSYSANKDGSLLIGGLLLSGSAANLSQNDNQNEEEALIYSNQSSTKNPPSSTQNAKSSRPQTTITGPTITLRNHHVTSVRQDSYNKLSQRS